MKIQIEQIMQQLKANSEMIRSLSAPISKEQADWHPDPETWSMKKVIEHFYNEERLDFRKHLQEMLNDPSQPWREFPHDQFIAIESFQQGLELFIKEREASLDWLRKLKSPDWDRVSTVSLAPGEGQFSISTGDVLVSWVAHDFLHIRQMNELHYAWLVNGSYPYKVDYAGQW